MEEEMQIEKQRSKKVKVEHEGGGFLPDDITREILSRLHVKSLLRYMAVSRHWKSLISHNSFKKLHRQKILNNYNPPLLLAFLCSGKNKYSLTTFNFHGKVIQEWSLPIISSTTYLRMLPFPSQSKLVCFFDFEKFYLCNPSTRQIFRLPNPPFGPLLLGASYGYGFAYVPSKDEYVILYLVKSDIDIWSCMMLTISISNDDDQLHFNSWRFVDAALNSHLEFYRPFGVFVSGAFYWLIFDRGVRKYVILSFSMENEGFSFIGIPKDFDKSSCGFRESLLEIKDKLYFMTSLFHNTDFELWMLSDVKNQLWTQSWSINYLNTCLLGTRIGIYRREYLKNYNETLNETHDNIQKVMRYPGMAQDRRYHGMGILCEGF